METSARLTHIKARYGYHLPDSDGWLNLSDPYLEFIAYDTTGTTISRNTTYKSNTLSPSWNETISLGSRNWSHLEVRVYDEDFGSRPDPLSLQQTYQLSLGTNRTKLIHHCYSGHVVLDISCS